MLVIVNTPHYKIYNELKRLTTMMSTLRSPAALRTTRDRTVADPETVLAIARIEGRDWNPKLYTHRGHDLQMAKIIGQKKVHIRACDKWSVYKFGRSWSDVLQGIWRSYKAYKVLKQKKKHSSLINYLITKKNAPNDIYRIILQYL